MDAPRAVPCLILTLLVLLFAATAAEAAPPTGKISVSPDPPNQDQPATFTFAPDPGSENASVEWDLDGVPGFEQTGSSVEHIYDKAGRVTVQMQITNGVGEFAVVPLGFDVNAPPVVDFDFNPPRSLPGDDVLFVAKPNEAGASFDWSFGDGAKSTDPTPRHAYSEPGVYTVTLTVKDGGGLTDTAMHDITVRQPPNQSGFESPGTGESAPLVTTAPDGGPQFMTPFPVIRIAGKVTGQGAVVRVLSVRARRGALARVRCRGKGCPTGVARRKLGGKGVRFHQFERGLRGGIRLEVFVRDAGTIGKYTRFLIRAGAPPKRTDRCLFPGAPSPRRCP